MNTESRIETLEKQVRTLRRAFFIAAGTAVIGASVAATAVTEIPDVIQARSFEVVNKQGKTSIRLKSLEDSFSKENIGSGMVEVMSSKGLPAVAMACGLSGGWILVKGTDPDTPRFMAGITAPENDHGGSWLGGFFLRHGLISKNDVVHVTMTPEGNGIIKTFDIAGEVTSAAPSSAP